MLDDAIKFEQEKQTMYQWGSGNRKEEGYHRQLAEWLKDYKRLLECVPDGRWISHKEHCEQNNLLPSGLGSYWWCSKCGTGIDSKAFSRVKYNFCPECGTRME